MLKLINEVSIFRIFTTEQKGYLAKLLEEKIFKQNEFIISEGESDRNLYLIHKGIVRVVKKNDLDEFVDIAYIREGEYFGELSLIDNKPRSAHIQAFEECSIYILSSVNYSHLCMKFPEVEAIMLKSFLIDIITKLRITSEDAININKRLLI